MNKLKKVYCGECECWVQNPNNVNKGACHRQSASTSDMAPSFWPETPPSQFCWEGIERNKELLVEIDIKKGELKPNPIDAEEADRLIKEAERSRGLL